LPRARTETTEEIKTALLGNLQNNVVISMDERQQGLNVFRKRMRVGQAAIQDE
jgi:hypothetical protein